MTKDTGEMVNFQEENYYHNMIKQNILFVKAVANYSDNIA